MPPTARYLAPGEILTRDTPGMSGNVEVVLDAIDAFNRGDVDRLVAIIDPRVRWHLVGVVGEPVYYEGPDGTRELFRDLGESWSEFSISIEDVHDLGDVVLVVGSQHSRGRASGVDVQARRAFLFELSGGVPAALRLFNDPDEGRRAAGLDG